LSEIDSISGLKTANFNLWASELGSKVKFQSLEFVKMSEASELVHTISVCQSHEFDPAEEEKFSLDCLKPEYLVNLGTLIDGRRSVRPCDILSKLYPFQKEGVKFGI
jgi:hypothetical protein